jgi:hypothetical protein
MNNEFDKLIIGLFIEKLIEFTKLSGQLPTYTQAVVALFKKQVKYKPTQLIRFLNNFPDYIINEIIKENGFKNYDELKEKIRKATNNYRANEHYKQFKEKIL